MSGMRLFRFLADFRYFQGKFHHFCESSKSGLKFYTGGEGVRRRSLDASSTTQEASTMFVRSTCVFRDVTVDGWNTEQSMTMFTYFGCSTDQLHPRYFSFRPYHSVWCNNSYWHCVSANKLYATSLIMLDNMTVHFSKLC